MCSELSGMQCRSPGIRSTERPGPGCFELPVRAGLLTQLLQPPLAHQQPRQLNALVSGDAGYPFHNLLPRQLTRTGRTRLGVSQAFLCSPDHQALWESDCPSLLALVRGLPGHFPAPFPISPERHPDFPWENYPLAYSQVPVRVEMTLLWQKGRVSTS